MTFDPDQFDFDHCEDEPIHIPEAIQGYGYLFAADPESGEIRIHSNNIDSLIRLEDRPNLVGRNLFDYFDFEFMPRSFIVDSYLRARRNGVRLPLELRLADRFLADPIRQDYHAVIYSSDGLMIIEIEPASKFKEIVSAKQVGKIYATNIAPTFQSLKDVQAVTQAIAQIVKDLTGFERVVVYRFNDDGSGTVISEAKDDDPALPSYLDFHYPASDIPAQARELYRRNWIRLNPDVDVEPVALVPSIRESRRKPLDLSQSILRAMSPIHVQYIRNQGLKASMSISLINEDKLWGLISCHHRTSHYIPQNIRMECESFAHLFGWQIYAKQEEVKARLRDRTDRTIDWLIEGLHESGGIIGVFRAYEREVLALMGATGFVFCTGEENVHIGQTPDSDGINAIARLAQSHGEDVTFHTENILDHLDIEESKLSGVRGALVIPLLSQRDYFTVWFRPETQRTIRWAGNPDEKQAESPKKVRLAPRNSFQLHEQKISGRSLPWKENDIEIAERFNKIFLRHALKKKIEMEADITKLEARDQVKNEFLATLAHELRNPLSPITNAVSILQLPIDEAKKQTAYRIIDRQLKHMVHLVDDLLDVSRITRGKVILNQESLQLNKVLENAIELSEPLIRERNHELIFEPGEQTVYVHGDFTRLSQCFGNVLNNAAKYTEPGGRIEIRVTPSPSDVVIEIKDNGVGIPPSHLKRVFDMFSQVDANSTQTRGGLGIGLTLTQSLIKIHNGSISVHSDGPNTGSTFKITLPAKTPPVAEGGVTKQDPGASQVQGKRILIVEDNADVAHMLAMLLQLKQHEVTVCTSATEALEQFPGLRPDLALLDIGLPGIDGLELCRRLRAMDTSGHTIFVAQTGWGQEEDKERSRAAGFDHHLVKPVDNEALDRLFAEVFKP